MQYAYNSNIIYVIGICKEEKRETSNVNAKLHLTPAGVWTASGSGDMLFVVGDASLNLSLFHSARHSTNNGVNGNIRQSQYQGNYANNFGVAGSYQYTYIYDNSNRLLKAENDSGNSSTSFDIINGNDKDGNFTGMKRYGSSNNLADNFSYQYFSGTNRLKKVSAGLADDYTYSLSRT